MAKDPEQNGLIIVDAQTGKQIVNFYRKEVNREFHRLFEQKLHLSGLQHHHRCARADLDRFGRGCMLLVPVQQDPPRQVHVRHRRNVHLTHFNLLYSYELTISPIRHIVI